MDDNEPKERTPRGMSRYFTHIDDAGFFKPPSLVPYKAAREDLRPPMIDRLEIGTENPGTGYRTSLLNYSYGFTLTQDDVDYIDRVKINAEEHQTWVQSHNFPNRIVIAANLYQCGTVILGVRHNGIEMNKQIAMLISVGKKPEGKAVQGFMDIFGQFKTREEAWIIANEAGQILPGKDKTPGILFSETIY